MSSTTTAHDSQSRTSRSDWFLLNGCDQIRQHEFDLSKTACSHLEDTEATPSNGAGNNGADVNLNSDAPPGGLGVKYTFLDYTGSGSPITPDSHKKLVAEMKLFSEQQNKRRADSNRRALELPEHVKNDGLISVQNSRCPPGMSNTLSAEHEDDANCGVTLPHSSSPRTSNRYFKVSIGTNRTGNFSAQQPKCCEVDLDHNSPSDGHTRADISVSEESPHTQFLTPEKQGVPFVPRGLNSRWLTTAENKEQHEVVSPISYLPMTPTPSMMTTHADGPFEPGNSNDQESDLHTILRDYYHESSRPWLNAGPSGNGDNACSSSGEPRMAPNYAFGPPHYYDQNDMLMDPHVHRENEGALFSSKDEFGSADTRLQELVVSVTLNSGVASRPATPLVVPAPNNTYCQAIPPAESAYSNLPNAQMTAVVKVHQLAQNSTSKSNKHVLASNLSALEPPLSAAAVPFNPYASANDRQNMHAGLGSEFSKTGGANGGPGFASPQLDDGGPRLHNSKSLYSDGSGSNAYMYSEHLTGQAPVEVHALRGAHPGYSNCSAKNINKMRVPVEHQPDFRPSTRSNDAVIKKEIEYMCDSRPEPMDYEGANNRISDQFGYQPNYNAPHPKRFSFKEWVNNLEQKDVTSASVLRDIRGNPINQKLSKRPSYVGMPTQLFATKGSLTEFLNLVTNPLTGSLKPDHNLEAIYYPHVLLPSIEDAPPSSDNATDTASQEQLSSDKKSGTGSGSAGHPTDCKPCAFHWTKGCINGSSCAFCHGWHAPKKKKPMKDQKNLMIIGRPDGKIEFLRCAVEDAIKMI